MGTRDINAEEGVCRERKRKGWGGGQEINYSSSTQLADFSKRSAGGVADKLSL